MACDGYTKVWELAPRELVLLDGARGTTLRVTRGRIWLTQERDPRDIVLAAGDVFTIERGGRTVVEAQDDATVCALAHFIEATRGVAATPTLGARLRDWLRPIGAAYPDHRRAPYY